MSRYLFVANSKKPRFAERDEMGLKPATDSTPTAAAEMKKPRGFAKSQVGSYGKLGPFLVSLNM